MVQCSILRLYALFTFEKGNIKISTVLLLPGGGHLNVTWREGAHFLRISTTCLGKQFAFQFPVPELLDYKKFKNNRGRVFYCS